jgi:hypothetical protein
MEAPTQPNTAVEKGLGCKDNLAHEKATATEIMAEARTSTDLVRILETTAEYTETTSRSCRTRFRKATSSAHDPGTGYVKAASNP